MEEFHQLQSCNYSLLPADELTIVTNKSGMNFVLPMFPDKQSWPYFSIMMIPKNQLTPTQVEQLASLRYINNIDEHMRIVSSVQVLDGKHPHGNAVLLVLDIFIDDKQIDKMSFNLHNYAYEEIIELAQHIRNNDFILRAVDTALAGDIE